jgi:hypothetical protein
MDPLLVRTEKAAAGEVAESGERDKAGSEKEDVADKAVQSAKVHG